MNAIPNVLHEIARQLERIANHFDTPPASKRHPLLVDHMIYCSRMENAMCANDRELRSTLEKAAQEAFHKAADDYLNGSA